MYGGVDVFGWGNVCVSYVLFLIQIPLSRNTAHSTERNNDSADGMTLDGIR